jgi:anthranilate synthase/indole-3-glycerol phosphate synthase/phosphoribosylanthranilate isomerase
MFDAGDLDRVVISPGPGHPTTDSGISREVITWGIGRLPILGICMGLECLVDLLGGEVSHCSICHGEHSLIKDRVRWRDQTWKNIACATRLDWMFL